MAAVEVPQTLEYKGGQLNAAPILDVETCQRKPKTQWTPEERKAANLDHRLKSLIMFVLPDDQMNSVIKCLTTKSTWDDLILYHEGPSDVKESRVVDLKLCHNTFKFKEESELAYLFGKLKYEENLINNIYDTNKEKTLVPAIPLSTAFFSTSIVQDFQDSPADEEDTKSSQEHTKDFEAKYNKVKAKLALLSSSASAPRSSSGKNKGLIPETYDWDEEEVSSEDNEVTKVKVLMALADEERVFVGKESAKIVNELRSLRKRYTLFLKWKIMMKNKKQSHQVNTEILRENQNLRNELKELTSIREAWLNGSNKVNQCISEQIPTQKKKIPSNKPRLSEAENSNLSNHDTVCSTPLPPLKKLVGYHNKWNHPRLLLEATKVLSASKTNSAPAGKLKNVKMEDDPPLSIVMKELNDLKLQISKNKSSYFRNKNTQQAPLNALQNKIQNSIFKMNCEFCGENKPSLEELFSSFCFVQKCKRELITRSCDHAEFMSSMNINQYHTGQGESSSRSRPSRPAISFPSPLKKIISLRRGIKPRNPQHVTKNCETCGSNVHTTSDHNDIEWFRKREALQAKKSRVFQSK
ncbi:hypothetical protein Tco_0848483 [Tanacetum coccineum]